MAPFWKVLREATGMVSVFFLDSLASAATAERGSVAAAASVAAEARPEKVFCVFF